MHSSIKIYIFNKHINLKNQVSNNLKNQRIKEFIIEISFKIKKLLSNKKIYLKFKNKIFI